MTSSEYPLEMPRGGIATFTYDLSHALVKKGHEVHIITMSERGTKNFFDEGVYVHCIKYKKHIRGRFWDQLNYGQNVYRAAARLIKEHSIEIIESPEFWAEGFFLSKIKILPLVVRCHTPYFLISQLLELSARGSIYALDDKIANIMEKSTIKSADKVTSCSVALARIISSECRIDLGEIEVIHNGINTQRFEVENNSSFRQKYGIRAEDRIVLYLGRLEKRKGVHILMKVMLPILKAFPDLFFVFVGKGDFYKRYIKEAVGLRYENRVIFTGHLDEVNKIRAIKSCDFLVIPSLWENFPYVCLEAMACEKPVIGTKFGGLKEIIVQGENGFLFDPYRSDELKMCITLLLNDKGKTLEMGKMARKTVETKFSENIMAKETIKVYNEILSG